MKERVPAMTSLDHFAQEVYRQHNGQRRVVVLNQYDEKLAEAGSGAEPGPPIVLQRKKR